MKKLLLGFSLILIAAGIAHSYIAPNSETMSMQRLLDLFAAHPEVTQLDQVPQILPKNFLINFVLKHGINRKGERGHLTETKVSQSADPLAPRVIIFDERTGFTVSYNGGLAQQKANQRLDILSFNHFDKHFLLSQIDFPVSSEKVAVTSSDCKSCHGPQQRPIFSMYPDWPAFYGSDNDELVGSSLVQKAEFSDYQEFRSQVVPKNTRYTPLFSNSLAEDFLKRKIYPSFPYRPDNSPQIREISRAFAFRPALRLGILYNRLNAQNIMARMKSHLRYSEFAPYFLHNLLQCPWPQQSESTQLKWQNKIEKSLGLKTKLLAGGGLDYRQAWQLFDLTINDVDIRYSYQHPAYQNEDASNKVMEVGYIGRYFNSYFDGSATIDELIAGAMYEDLIVEGKLHGPIKLWGLVEKYQHLTERFALDKDFFIQMDHLGKWIHIPFPKQLSQVHHRETFTANFAKDHQALCSELASVLSSEDKK